MNPVSFPAGPEVTISLNPPDDSGNMKLMISDKGANAGGDIYYIIPAKSLVAALGKLLPASIGPSVIAAVDAELGLK